MKTKDVLGCLTFASSLTAAPVINSGPSNTTVFRAETARFQVSATGVQPLAYQWFKSVNPIPNGTNSILTIPNVRTTDAGQYRVRVFDSSGSSVASSLASLTVIDPTVQTAIITALGMANLCSSGSNPQGAGTLLVGTRRNQILDRGILRFDIGALPPNVQITSAKLHMTIVKVPSGFAEGTSLVIHRMLRTWDASASWTVAKLGEPWAADGGMSGMDFALEASASAFVEGVAEYEMGSTPQMVSDVQAWQNDPGSNNGWLFKSDSEATPKSARHYGSPISPQPPHLFVGYVLPPTAPQISPARLQGTNMIFELNPSPGRLYYIDYSGSVDDGLWLPLTNAPSGNGLAQVVITVPITATNRFLRATVE